MTTATLPAPVPALARRPSPATAVANSFTLAWRSVLKIKTNPLRVSELGNSSGGYRPGPLRNALVLARFIDHGIVQDDLAGTAVDNRPDGTYDHSHILYPSQS